MQMIKRSLILFLIGVFLPISVYAGNISYNGKTTSDNKYTFTITANDLDLNYISGKIKITNGYITNITMSNNWVNKTGNNNEFYFYHDDINSGNYEIATVEVTMTNNSTYTISNINYGTYKCQKDIYENYFDSNGNITTKDIYDKTCNLSKDATLKSLTTNVGEFTKPFSKNNYYYNLKISKDTKIITFKASTSDDNAKIISGLTCDATKSNECRIIVTSQNGNTITYYITLITDEVSSLITDFKVSGGVLSENFTNTKYDYTVTINKNASEIYFNFNLNGTNYTSDKCSALATNCKLTINEKTYTFNLINQEVTSTTSKDTQTKIDNSTNKTTTKKTSKATSKSNSKTTSKKNTDSATSKTTEDDTSLNEVSTSNKEELEENVDTDEEETIDPVEYNKNKETTNIELSSKDEEVNDYKTTSNKKNLILTILICLANVLLVVIIITFIKKRKR
jgi:hypothetical protein